MALRDYSIEHLRGRNKILSAAQNASGVWNWCFTWNTSCLIWKSNWFSGMGANWGTQRGAMHRPDRLSNNLICLELLYDTNSAFPNSSNNVEKRKTK